MRKATLFLFLLLTFNTVSSQTREELWNDWIDTSIVDSLRLNALKTLIIDYYIFNQPDSVPYYTTMQYDFAALKNNHFHMFSALNNEGVSYYLQGEYDLAIACYQKASLVLKQSKSYKNLGAVLTNIGMVYLEKDSYFKAIEYLNQSIIYEDSAKNLSGKAASYENLGIIYRTIYEDSIASDYYFKSLNIRKLIGDEKSIANSLNNIGLLFYDSKLYEDAQGYFTEALEICNQNNYDKLKSKLIFNLGLIYFEKNNLKKAKNYFTISYELQKSFNDQHDMSASLKELASLYVILEEYKKAINCGLDALEIAENIQSKSLMRDGYFVLSTAYSNAEDFKKAFAFKTKYIEINDILNEQENEKEIYIELERNKFKTEKKELLANYQREKDNQEIKFLLEQKNKTIKQNGLIILVVVLLLFAIFWYYRLRLSNKQKKLIENQKILVDISNKEVMDSINYAQRIQDALLKAKEHISKHLPPHFVLFKPKNVVSGDFYWYSEKKGFVYIAVADCTGHGVPGAMLSMLGISFLNEINTNEELFTPAQILDLLKIKVVNELSQVDSTVTVSDGMDISLLRMNLNSGEIVWAGANNPLYIYANSTFSILNSTRQPISFTDKVIPYEDHYIDCDPNAVYYLFSDGYFDQFGGPRGKKLKQTGFLGKLKEIANESLADQLILLEDYFELWKGDFDQLDDVTIIAIKAPEIKN